MKRSVILFNIYCIISVDICDVGISVIKNIIIPNIAFVCLNI